MKPNFNPDDISNYFTFYKGGGFSAPKPPETVTKVEDKANAEIERQKKRSYLAMGKQSTILGGIQTMLKDRLG